MAEQLEVIFVDKAGASATPQQNQSAPDNGQSPSGRTPGPSDRVVGPKKPDSQGIGRDLENAAQKIANALGIGGLTGTALELRKAFSRLYESVTAAEKAVESKRSADVGGGGPSGEVKGPAKPVSPKPGDVTAPPVIRNPLNPSVPNVGAFERQMAKGDIAGPAVSQAVRGPTPNIGWFERMTAARGGAVAPPVSGAGIPNAVPGVPVAPPVVGPAAGAGTAASGMARLAAAAGPAALAVGVLVGAVVAGAVAIKKTADGLHNEAQRLAGLSGPLSGATARNEIRSEFADIRRAGRIGPQLSQLEDSRGQIMSKLADLNTEILKVVVELFNALQPAIPPLVNGIGVVAAAIPVQVDTLKAIFQFLNGDWKNARNIDADEMKNLNRLAGSIKKLIENEVEDMKGSEDPFSEAFLNQFGGAVQPTRRDRIRASRRERGRA